MNKEQTGKRERQTLSEKLIKKLDIQPDILPGGSLIAIRGRASVSVSGSTGIVLYTPEEIRLSLRRGTLSIKGCRLVCTSYNAEELSIDGKINSVVFEEE